MVDYDKNVDSIAEFGPSFQNKVIASLLKSDGFLGQSMDVLNPHFFDNEAGQWIVNKIIAYYNDYKTAPRLDFFKVEIKELEKNDVLKTSVLSQLKESHGLLKSNEDLRYIEDSFLEFCKTQKLKVAILKSVDLLKRKQYNDIKSIIDEAIKAGTQKDPGLNWSEDVTGRHIENARDTVPTGWGPIDKLLDGGLGPGELGCIAAPSGIGKSWALQTIASNAMRKGLKVVYYTFELNQNYVGVRFDTIFSGIEPQFLKFHLDEIQDIISKVPGKIYIKYFPPRTASVYTLQAHLDYLISKNYTPDIILVDYADLLLPSRKAEARYQELAYVYEDLRKMAGELQVPIWTASQTQRSSINDDVIEADKIAESYDKVKTADVLISISRKMEDKLQKVARAHIMKNRFGEDGLTFPMVMDTAIGKIEVLDAKTTDGQAAQEKMTNGDKVMKDFLKSKLMQFEQTESE